MRIFKSIKRALIKWYIHRLFLRIYFIHLKNGEINPPSEIAIHDFNRIMEFLRDTLYSR